MHWTSLAEALERLPDIPRRLLGSYGGAFSVGVTRSPKDAAESAVLVRVEGSGLEEVPSHVSVDGEQVPVVVVGNFKPPKPL